MPSRSHSWSRTKAPQPTRVDDLDVGPDNRGARRRKIEDPADRGDQPRQRLLVYVVLPPEVVDDLGHQHAGLRVPLVVSELQVGDLRAVLVPSAGLSQVHTYVLSKKSAGQSMCRVPTLFKLFRTSKLSDQGRCHPGPPKMPTNSVMPDRDWADGRSTRSVTTPSSCRVNRSTSVLEGGAFDLLRSLVADACQGCRIPKGEPFTPQGQHRVAHRIARRAADLLGLPS